MLSKVKEMMQTLPNAMAEIVKFAVMMGLRPSEACASVRFPKSTSKQQQYYNHEHQTIEHFRFLEIFLRPTKKAYLSYLSRDNYQRIANLGPKTPLA
jgi:hypothetical protein